MVKTVKGREASARGIGGDSISSAGVGITNIGEIVPKKSCKALNIVK